MGAFLSEPVTDKISADEDHKRLRYGVCSMQGWRLTQEDNHSCFPKLTEDTSLFGVYDGHGGAEVSRYVASLLPIYVLERECWKEGEIGKALSEAFLALDAHLGSRKGLRTLKKYAAEDDAALDKEKNKSSADDDGESEDSSEENVRNLFKEAKMPLEKLMAKYGQALAAAHNASESSEEGEEGTPSASKSPKGSKPKDGEKEEATDGVGGSSAGSAKALKSEKEEAKEGEKGESGEGGKPKENGLPEEDKPVTKNGSGGGTKLRSRKNRIVYSDNDDDEDSSDEEYDENSSSLMEGEDEEESSGEDDDEDEEDMERSIATSDQFALNMLQGPGLDSGCTAVVAVLQDGGILYVANAGDSRCILSRGGVAIDMSVDHKPEDETESKRIKDAGGEVTSEGRVNGGLNLSRALGDHAYKQGDCRAREQMISALPDVARIKLRRDEDEFMVLACDGIWNSMTSQDVVDFVREKLYKTKDKVPADVKERMKMSEGVKLSEICGDMFDQCLAPNTNGDGTGCDNMTAILVTFKDTMWKGECDGDKPKVKEEKEDVVYLTPPPSPPPVPAEEDDVEDSSLDEEEEEELEDEDDDDEEEEEKEDKVEDEEEEMEVVKKEKESEVGEKVTVKKEKKSEVGEKEVVKKEKESEEGEKEVVKKEKKAEEGEKMIVKKEKESEEGEEEVLKMGGAGKGCKRLVSKDSPIKMKKQKVADEETS